MDDFRERLGALEAETRAEIRNIRTELTTAMLGLRSEVTAATQGMRAEATSELRHVRELLEGIAARMKEDREEQPERIRLALAPFAQRLKLLERLCYGIILLVVGAVVTNQCTTREPRSPIPTTRYEDTIPRTLPRSHP